jgi:hypothetical protein
MKPGDSLFPVAAWEIHTLKTPDADGIVLQLSFLSMEEQPVERLHPGRRYVLKRGQIVELRDALSKALQRLEGAS